MKANSWIGRLAFFMAASLYALACPVSTLANDVYEPRPGDLVFQISGSAQAEAVRLVTGATYGHVGIVFVNDGQVRILEAGGPGVHYSSFETFVNRTQDRSYVVKRLKESRTLISPESLARMQMHGEAFVGLRYDRVFSWTDAEMYCTELVWKIYERVLGVELGKLNKLGDFNLAHPGVQSILEERYGDTIPLEEIVISPAELFASDVLETVYTSAD